MLNGSRYIIGQSAPEAFWIDACIGVAALVMAAVRGGEASHPPSKHDP